MTQKLEFDYTSLEKKYKNVFGTQEAFAEAIGIDRTSLIKRLSNEVPFKGNEIKLAALLLGISADEIHLYFFTEKVEKSQTANQSAVLA